jgi:DNA-binding NarL/FixJ family response regulator
LLSLHSEARFVKAACGAGIAGYVLRDAACEKLPGAIREVAADSRYLSPTIASPLVS